MESKIEKLEEATQQAKEQMEKLEKELEDSNERLDLAKTLLKALTPEEQQNTKVTDTKLPELMEMNATVKEAYETTKKRYETNLKYLQKLKATCSS
jgi:D-serine dehydratase